MTDLRKWLGRVQQIGELQTIDEEIDWDEEIGALTYMVGKREVSPALLFTKIRGHNSNCRLLSNILGSSPNRIALALRLPTQLPLVEMIERTRTLFKRRIPPKVVEPENAPVNENVLQGEQIDVLQFPAPKFWPLDGGRYIGTANITITQDPDTGRLNLGVYRQMVHNRKEIGLYLSPGKDALLDIERWWAKGKPAPVAVAHGIDPLFLLVGAMGFPKNISEFDCAGGIAGRPIEVVKGDVTGLLFPAQAEIVMEGFCHPHSYKPEGPFGEFQGYYGRPMDTAPYIDIQCVRHRKDPVLTCALMADHPSCEQNLFFGVVRSARIWDDLDALGLPGVVGVYSVPAAAGGFGMVVISIEQRYAGHAAQVAAVAAQSAGGAYYTKWIVVVDEDVDPTDLNQVIWAMSTRCHPAQDIDILRQTWSTYLDPSRNPPEIRPYGSKVLIKACMEHRHLEDFSRRTRLRREVYERLKQRWSSLGLEGVAPAIRTFEAPDSELPG